jgi:hypothetical protein
MTKGELAQHLKTTDLYANPSFREAIDAADAKYNGTGVVKARAEKIKPSLEAIRARADAETAAE